MKESQTSKKVLTSLSSKDTINSDTFDFEFFKNFVNTYKVTDASCNQNYSNETIIKDMLYGMGISLNKHKYTWADGFTKFINLLKNII